MTIRIFASISLLFSVLFLPFWFAAGLALLSVVYFRFFWEGIPIFLLSDFLYGVPEFRYINVVFVSSIIYLIFMFSAEALKRKVRAKTPVG